MGREGSCSGCSTCLSAATAGDSGDVLQESSFCAAGVVETGEVDDEVAKEICD